MASRQRTKKLTHFEVVNRWCLDFYVAEALDAFRDDEYTRFSQIREHLQSLLEMPIEANSSITIKLLVMQFLSRIYEGDKLDTEFETEDYVVPLESAMAVLEKICEEVEVPQSDLERVHTLLREMVVVICIKSKNFTKAKEMLQKHFPSRKSPTGKAKLLSDLVQQKCSSHPTLEHPSYSQFRQNTLDFIERVYTMPQPFLKMVVRMKNGLVEEPQIIKRRSQRLENGTQTENHTVLTSEPRQEQDAPEHSDCPPLATPHALVTLRELRQVYESQAQRLGIDVPFATLVEEVYKEAVEVPEETRGGEEEQLQQQQQEEEEEEEEVVTQKVTNLEENVPEMSQAAGEEAHAEAEPQEVMEVDSQTEEEVEEEKEEDTQENEGLHLYLSETPLEDFEREQVVTQEEEAMEEEEEQEEEQERDKRKDKDEAATPVSPPLYSTPEKTMEMQLEPEQDRQGGAGEGDTEVLAVSEDSSQKEPEAVREEEEEEEEEETGRGVKEEVSLTEGRKLGASDVVDDAVVPAVSPPRLSPSHMDSLFSQTESPSLLAQPIRLTRSRRQVASLTTTTTTTPSRTTPAADNSHASPPRNSSPPPSPSLPVYPQAPTSKSSDPADQAKSVVKGSDGPSVHPESHGPSLAHKSDAPPLPRKFGGRYCTVSVAQLVMMPDSQPVTSQSEKRSSSDSDFTPAGEDSVSTVGDPLLPSEPEEYASTPPLSSTPDRGRGRRSQRPTRDPLSDSLDRGSLGTPRRSKEVSSVTPKGGSATPSTTLRRGSATPCTTPKRGSASGNMNSEDKSSATPARGTPGAGRRSRELGSSTPIRTTSSDAIQRSEELGSTTPSRGGSKTPGRRRDSLPDTPVRPGVTGAKRRKEPLSFTKVRPGTGSGQLLNDSTDEDAQNLTASCSPPVRKRRKELTMSRIMNATATREEWSDEESLFKDDNAKREKPRSNGKKRIWTEEESRWVREGVARFGVGKWAQIHSAYPFTGRTSVNIKDRWRTMKNTGLI